MENFLNLADIIYFTPQNAKFYLNSTGFVCLNAFLPPVVNDDLVQESSKDPIWQDLGRIYLHRMFPFDLPNEYISVLDKEEKEYGIIRRLSDFDQQSIELLNKELNRKYLCPEIQKINSLKDRMGYSYWEVETDKGEMSFAMYDTFRNITRVSDTRLVLTDVDGNRFSILDVLALDPKSYKKIELYL